MTVCSLYWFLIEQLRFYILGVVLAVLYHADCYFQCLWNSEVLQLQSDSWAVAFMYCRKSWISWLYKCLLLGNIDKYTE